MITIVATNTYSTDTLTITPLDGGRYSLHNDTTYNPDGLVWHEWDTIVSARSLRHARWIAIKMLTADASHVRGLRGWFAWLTH